MTREHEYAYETGYQDGLKAAEQTLEAENAKLRELVDCFVLAAAPSRREILTSNAIGLWAEQNGIEVDG